MLYHTSAKPLPPCGKASFAARKSLFRSSGNILSRHHQVYMPDCQPFAQSAHIRIFQCHSFPPRLRTILAGKCLTLRIFLVDHTLTYARYCPLLYATSSGQPRRPTPHQPRHTAAPQSSCTRHTAHKRPRPYKKEVKGRCGIIFLQKNLVV